MKTPNLLYVGIRGSVVALHRDTGEIAWRTHLKGAEFVNLIVDGDHIYATTYGEAFCLDARSGQSLWHNRLKGLGLGLASLATPDDLRTGVAALLAEKRRQDDASSSAASVST